MQAEKFISLFNNSISFLSEEWTNKYADLLYPEHWVIIGKKTFSYVFKNEINHNPLPVFDEEIISDYSFHYHFLKNKKSGNIPAHSKFHVINLDNVEYSRRVNPLKPEYMRTIAEASETAESLVFALLKTGSAGKGSEQFFNQSAINFLSAVLYFFSKQSVMNTYMEEIKNLENLEKNL